MYWFNSRNKNSLNSFPLSLLAIQIQNPKYLDLTWSFHLKCTFHCHKIFSLLLEENKSIYPGSPLSSRPLYLFIYLSSNHGVYIAVGYDLWHNGLAAVIFIVRLIIIFLRIKMCPFDFNFKIMLVDTGILWFLQLGFCIWRGISSRA